MLGADPRVTDAEGRTMLMLAAASDAVPVDAVKALVARGVDVNAKSKRGDTALGLARLRGATPVIDVLSKAGAVDVPLSGRTHRSAVAGTVGARGARAQPAAATEDRRHLLQEGGVRLVSQQHGRRRERRGRPAEGTAGERPDQHAISCGRSPPIWTAGASARCRASAFRATPTR